MVKTFVIRCQYETSTGTKKSILHKKLEANVLKTIRAKLFEGCLEASFQVIGQYFSLGQKHWFSCKINVWLFQPLLQIYLLLPCLISKISCHKSTDVTSVTEFFAGSLQIYSIVSSVVSLGWSFSTYEANQKKGALDFSSNPMARSIILMSALMQVRFLLTTGIYIL